MLAHPLSVAPLPVQLAAVRLTSFVVLPLIRLVDDHSATKETRNSGESIVPHVSCSCSPQPRF